MVDFDNLLFRASSMGDIMTGVEKGWSVDKSITCQRKLVQIYRELTWGRRASKTNKYTEKGTKVEENSITTYCRVKKTMYKKNDVRLTNDFFTGEFDLYEGVEILKANKIIDIKSSYDWTTFPSICDKLEPKYDYQIHTYMDLTGASNGVIAHVLENNTPEAINKLKLFAKYEKGMLDSGGNESDAYIAKCVEIEKNHIYDIELFKKSLETFDELFEFHTLNWHYDIPIHQRVHEIEVVRDEAKIEKMKNRVIECREWMKKNFN